MGTLFGIMPTEPSPKQRAMVEDLLAIPEHERYHEIIDGELIQKAMPSGRHGKAQAELTIELGGSYGPRSRGRGPGGWVFLTETEVVFEPHQVFRPDIAGWHRDRIPCIPNDYPITLRPDWVCEILSPNNKQIDLLKKLRVYQGCRVPHYWIVDPEIEMLIVYRWTEAGYLVVLTADGEERFRAEPFDAIELSVRDLLQLDEEQG